MMKLTRRLLIATAFATSLSPALLAAEKPRVVASFSILADMAARVGGDKVEVSSLVGPNGDAHVYEPAPADAKTIAEADLVVVNGLGFEGWFARLVEASGYKGPVVTASEGVAAAKMDEEEEHAEAGHDDDHDHDHGAFDPHAWQNAANTVIYAGNIAKALCEADTANCETYKSNAAAYVTELKALDAEIKAAVERVPADRRTVIMSHDAFGYFARAYGITVLAPEGVSTDSEASAQDVAKLIAQTKDKKAAALFVENVSDPRLIEQISRETGLSIGGELYSDALSPPDGPAASYIAMMRHNARLLTAAMAGS
jgi:zinc/manganese transport system substrate-binding protein